MDCAPPAFAAEYFRPTKGAIFFKLHASTYVTMIWVNLLPAGTPPRNESPVAAYKVRTLNAVAMQNGLCDSQG
jgi:hypothetical protein